jgi:uncharacterized membrane protein
VFSVIVGVAAAVVVVVVIVLVVVIVVVLRRHMQSPTAPQKFVSSQSIY